MTSQYEIKTVETKATKSGLAWVVLDSEGNEVARFKNQLAAAMRVLREEYTDAVIESDDASECKATWEARTVRA